MLLLDKPQHRTFPSDFRYKVIFESTDANIPAPPLYVYIDNSLQWRVDTFWMVEAVRLQITAMFTSLYHAHFDVLTVPKILEAVEYADALLTQDARLEGDANAPFICVHYYDQEAVYHIPGRYIGIQKIRLDDILEDITGHLR